MGQKHDPRAERSAWRRGVGKVGRLLLAVLVATTALVLLLPATTFARADDAQETGQLTICQLPLCEEAADASREFAYRVTFEGLPAGDCTLGGVELRDVSEAGEDGAAQHEAIVILKGGESVTVDGLPLGTTYRVAPAEDVRSTEGLQLVDVGVNDEFHSMLYDEEGFPEYADGGVPSGVIERRVVTAASAGESASMTAESTVAFRYAPLGSLEVVANSPSGELTETQKEGLLIVVLDADGNEVASRALCDFADKDAAGDDMWTIATLQPGVAYTLAMRSSTQGAWGESEDEWAVLPSYEARYAEPDGRVRVYQNRVSQVTVSSECRSVLGTAELTVTKGAGAGASDGADEAEACTFQLASYAVDGEDLLTRGDVMPGVSVLSEDAARAGVTVTVRRLADAAEGDVEQGASTYEVGAFGAIGFTQLGTFTYTIVQVATAATSGETTTVGDPMFVRVVIEDWGQGPQVFFAPSLEELDDAAPVDKDETGAFLPAVVGGAGEAGSDPGDAGEAGQDEDDGDAPRAKLRIEKVVRASEGGLSDEERELISYKVSGELLNTTLTLADFTRTTVQVEEGADDEGAYRFSRVVGDESEPKVQAEGEVGAEASEGGAGSTASAERYVWESDWLPVSGDATKDTYTIKEINATSSWNGEVAYQIDGHTIVTSAEGVSVRLAEGKTTNVQAADTIVPPAFIIYKQLDTAGDAGAADARTPTFSFSVELTLDESAGDNSVVRKNQSWKNTTFRGTLFSGGKSTDSPVKFTDGKAVVKLRAGQSQSVEYLPIGVRYTVTELQTSGYVLKSVTGTGTADEANARISDVISSKLIKKHKAVFTNAHAGSGTQPQPQPQPYDGTPTTGPTKSDTTEPKAAGSATPAKVNSATSSARKASTPETGDPTSVAGVVAAAIAGLVVLEWAFRIPQSEEEMPCRH